jgi:hypothetical protein
MANGTTTLEEEEFTLPPPERVGEEHGSLTAIVQELVYTVDHKKLGLMYITSGLLFFVVAGIMATLMRFSSCLNSKLSRRFQPVLCRMRYRHDFSRGDAVGLVSRTILFARY